MSNGFFSCRSLFAGAYSLQEPLLQELSFLQELFFEVLQEPSLQEPSLQEPSLQEPSLQEPSLQEPFGRSLLFAGTFFFAGATSTQTDYKFK